MKIAICSDLHLEFGDIVLKNDEGADVLILGGDIMVAEDLHDHPAPVTSPYTWNHKSTNVRQMASQLYRDFLQRCSNEFPNVIYVAGNHEFYHGKWISAIQDLRNECARYKNVHFLERDTKIIDDVVFVGGTLWTDMNKGDPLTLHAVGAMMNDYQCIRHDGLGYTSLRPTHTVQRHIETKQYIEFVVKEHKDSKVVVVGHHSPSHLSIDKRYANESLMNGAYFSDLSELILDHPQIKLWTHGHTHHPFDYSIGDTRIVCNPRGYTPYDETSKDFELKYVEV